MASSRRQMNVACGYGRNLSAICASFLLITCGGADKPTPVYTIGGVVSGLTGSGLVLRNRGSDDVSIAANGSFTFATALASGSAYSVTVQTQPADPTLNCIVMDAGRAGVVQNANVTAVSVVCAEIARVAYVGYVDSASGRAASVALGIDPG